MLKDKASILKILNILCLFTFMYVASVAPFVSAMGASLAFAQNPEERGYSSNSLLEEKIDHKAPELFIQPPSFIEINFVTFVVLKPQIVPEDFLKPPSYSVL